LPQPFLAVFAVFVLVVPPDTHTAKHFLSQARVPPFISQTTFHKFHFVCSFSPTLAQPAKNYTTQQKIAPALPLRGRCPAHFVLSLSATLAPLADGSRLSIPQAKKSLR